MNTLVGFGAGAIMMGILSYLVPGGQFGGIVGGLFCVAVGYYIHRKEKEDD